MGRIGHAKPAILRSEFIAAGVAFAAQPGGVSTQNGYTTIDSYLNSRRLVPAPDCSRTGYQPRNGGQVSSRLRVGPAQSHITLRAIPNFFRTHGINELSDYAGSTPIPTQISLANGATAPWVSVLNPQYGPDIRNLNAHVGGLLLILTRAVGLMLVCYPLSLPPLVKLIWNHPRIGAILGPPVEVMYRPLINYLCRHPYGPLDRFMFWYATRIWELPMMRN